MFLNLLFTSLKRDDSVARQRAFVKRILQVSLTCPPQLACGLLYLVSELLKTKPELNSFRQQPTQFGEEDDDDEEHYEDADDEAAIDEEDADQNAGDRDEEAAATEDKQAAASDQGSTAEIPADKDGVVSSTWIHRNNAQTKAGRKGYDPLARNPMYARAEESGGFWEMLVLAEHHHPSVSVTNEPKLRNLV